MAREKDYESMLQNWPAAYYETRDAWERRRLLEMSLEGGLDPEKDKIRRVLWEIRYPEIEGKSNDKNNGLQDTFLRAWMTFSFASDRVKSRFARNGLLKELKKELSIMGPEVVREFGDAGEAVLYDELYHMSGLYLELCSEDRGYGSIILGLGKMKKESFVAKVAGEVYAVGYKVPRALGLEEECRLLTKAATEAFYDKFLNYEEYLDRLIQE